MAKFIDETPPIIRAACSLSEKQKVYEKLYENIEHCVGHDVMNGVMTAEEAVKELDYWAKLGIPQGEPFAPNGWGET